MPKIEFDLLELCETVSLKYAEHAKRKDMALVVFMEPELPKLFVADAEKLKTILQTLLRSVIENARCGCDIGIAIAAADPTSDVTVIATGVRFGITYTDIGSRPDTGNAQELLSELGTDLHFRQDVGRGSELYFALVMPISERFENRPLYTQKMEPIPTFVISNEPPPNRSLHLSLRYWGLRCDGAPTMQEGLLEITREAALGSPYKLIVIAEPIDDATPEQIARIIRGSDLKDTRLIHVDRYEDAASKQQSMEAGFDAYIAKPFRQIDLLRLVAEQIDIDPSLASDTVEKIVLVVDDNVTNQKLAVFQLRRLSVDTAVSSNGKEALEALKRSRFHLVLLDLDMPVMNGFETLEKIREQAELRDLPVVIVTANSDEKVRERCMNAGASEFVVKPISGKRMEEIVTRWIPQHVRPDPSASKSP